jgi:hypothetical protein
MNSPGEFGQYLQNLIDRHPQDLSIILTGLGIDAPASPYILVLAHERYGDVLTRALERLPESNFSGVNWKDLFNQGIDLITGGNSDSAPNAPAPETDDNNKWSTSKIVLIGLATLAILVTIYIVIKKLN